MKAIALRPTTKKNRDSSFVRESSVWPLLGFCRLFLCLIVVAGHLPGFSGEIASGFGPVSFLQLFSAKGAVLVFLVISGFSIAASYQQEQTYYYFRRALRILPLYVLTVTASAVIPIFFNDVIAGPVRIYVTPTYSELALNLCFAQGFLTDNINTNAVVWSLSVEVFFYAITPWLMSRTNREIFWAIVGSGILFAWVCIDDDMQMYPKGFGLNVPLLGWTWLLGLWLYRRGGDRGSVISGLIAGTLVMPFTTSKWFFASWALVIGTIAIGSKLRLPRVAANLCLIAGDTSYPLYLIHFPYFILLLGLGKKHTGWTIVSAMTIAFILDRIYDRPLKRMLRKLSEKFFRWRNLREPLQPQAPRLRFWI